MSNDCRVSGTISLKDTFSEEQIATVLQPFLDHFGLNFKCEVNEGNITLDQNLLYLSVDVRGLGGYGNPEIEDLADSLSQIVAGADWFEFFDFDTGDLDAMRTPYFLGTAEDKVTARLRYGINEMAPWVLPILGKEAFEYIEKVILCFQVQK